MALPIDKILDVRVLNYQKNPAVMECGSGTECSGPGPESIVLSDRSETPSTASLRSGSDSGSDDDDVIIPDVDMPSPMPLSSTDRYANWQLKRIVHIFRDYDNVPKFIVQLSDNSLRFVPTVDGNKLWPQAVFAFHDANLC